MTAAIIAGTLGVLASLAWYAAWQERLAAGRVLATLEAVAHRLESSSGDVRTLVGRANAIDKRAAHRLDDADAALEQARELHEQATAVLGTPGLSRASRVLHCWVADHPMSPDCSDVQAVAALLSDAANAAPPRMCACPRATSTR